MQTSLEMRQTAEAVAGLQVPPAANNPPRTPTPPAIIVDLVDDEDVARPQRTEKDLIGAHALTSNTWDHIGVNPVRDTFDFTTPTHLTFQSDLVNKLRQIGRAHLTANGGTSASITSAPIIEEIFDNNEVAVSSYNAISDTLHTEIDKGAIPKTNKYREWRAEREEERKARPGGQMPPVYTSPITTTATTAAVSKPTENEMPIPRPLPVFSITSTAVSANVAISTAAPQLQPIFSTTSLESASVPINGSRPSQGSSYLEPLPASSAMPMPFTPPQTLPHVHVGTPDPRRQLYMPVNQFHSVQNYLGQMLPAPNTQAYYGPPVQGQPVEMPFAGVPYPPPPYAQPCMPRANATFPFGYMGNAQQQAYGPPLAIEHMPHVLSPHDQNL